MAWEIAPAQSAFPPFATEWDRLNSAIYGGHPMFDSRFVLPLLEFFGDGSEKLCIHRTSTTADGALILRPLGLGRWELFLPAQCQAGAVLLADTGLLETLMPALSGFAWSIDLLALDPNYCPDWKDLRLPQCILQHSLTMKVAVDGAFDDYWQSRSRKLINNISRYRRRSQEQLGTPLLVTVTDAHQIWEAVARYGTMESAGWKGKAGTAVGMDNVQGHFYEKVMLAFATTGNGRVLELYIGEKMVASRLIIQRDRMWVTLKTTYDESLAAMAPGRQLLYEALQQAFLELHHGTVEFYTNVTHDQAEWATSLRYISHRQLFRNDVLGTAYSFAKTLLGFTTMRASKPTKEAATTVQPVTIECYQSTQELSPATIQLLDDFGRQNVEFSTTWFENLQRTVFAKGTEVRYYVGKFNGSPSVVLPVRLTRRGVIRQIESLANYYTSLYAPIVAPRSTANDLVPMLTAASRDHGRAAIMRFAPMDPDSQPYEILLTALRSCGWIPFQFFCAGNWYLKVDDSWAEYLEQREGRLRSTIKRMGRKFAAECGTFEIVTDQALVEPAIQAFNSVYALSWKKPEPYPEFIPGLIRWLAREGKLRLGIARLAGRPIAAQIWIVSHGKASIFKLAYDKKFAAFSPGTLLTACLMEHVIERDHVTEVDYLIGDDAYKQDWMSDRRERWGIIAYNPKTVFGLAILLREVIGRTIRKRTQARIQGQSMTWEIVPVHHFVKHVARWDGLQRLCANVPFLESLFLLPLLDEFGTGHEMVAFASKHGELRAAAILTKTRLGFWQTFQPAQLPLGTWLCKENTDLAALNQSLLRALPGFNIGLGITQLDPIFQRRPLESPGIRTLDYIRTAWIDIDQAFDSYWEARGKNLKTNNRKQRSKLQAEGVVPTLESITAPANVAQAIQDYGVLESTGWKEKDGTAVHPSNAQGRFYQKMLENFCAQGRGRIYRYRFNDKVVAMDLCIEQAEKIVILKTAYDESYKTVSSSSLMRHDEFRELFNEGKLKRIEFYGKLMEWHTRWTNNARTLYHVTVYRWTVVDTLHNRLRTRRRANNDGN